MRKTPRIKVRKTPQIKVRKTTLIKVRKTTRIKMRKTPWIEVRKTPRIKVKKTPRMKMSNNLNNFIRKQKHDRFIDALQCFQIQFFSAKIIVYLYLWRLDIVYSGEL